MHDVACEFARAAVRSKDAQKQLARTSLNRAKVLRPYAAHTYPKFMEVHPGGGG